MELLIILFLILLNGVFSMSEIALVSARKFKLESSARKGNGNAKKALELSNNPNTFLSTVQLGITLIGILTGIFSGEKMTTDVEAFVSEAPVLAPYAHSIAVGIIVLVVTYFSIVFGELMPKRVGMTYPETIATIVARPMSWLSVITKPFIWLLAKTNDIFLKLVGVKPKDDEAVSEEEIRSIITESAQSGEIQKIEQNIVERVFNLGDRKVGELMTHRTDIIWLDIKDDLKTVRKKVKQELHSAYPVCDGQIDKLVGLLLVQELFPIELSDETFTLKDYLRKPLVVPEKTPAYHVLERFKEQKFHYAIVVDEYGSIQGILSMDDVVDALLGDVAEYNHEEYQIIKRDENSWLADGQLPFFVFLHHFDLDELKGSIGFNTLAGLVINSLGHIPVTGEKVKWGEFEFEIIDMDGNRIDKILIKKQ